MKPLREKSRRHVALKEGADLAGFRRAVRTLVADRMPPQDVVWQCACVPELFDAAATSAAPPIGLPRAAADMIDYVVCHRDPERYGLLYALVWRLLHGERELLKVSSDPLVHRLEMMRKTIRRDLHKMHAFLRFRRIEDKHEPDGERFVAWFEPDHFILESTAQFFIDRFRALRWSILTPIGSLHWDRATLTVGPPATRSDAPEGDAFESGWRDYYKSTFNPARVNPAMMRAEMPKKYWKNMPEAASIPHLIHSAPSRVREMIEREAAMPKKRNPEKAVAAMARQAPQSLEELNRIIAASEPLVPGASRAVLGEGPIGASLAFVGEQPGDQEDLAGRPFVGPAGQVLNRALRDAGIDRAQAYMTNAIKHFKFSMRGKRRIHERPTVGEIKHYRWWLMDELAFVKPRLTIALGATAAQALADKPVSVTRERGPVQFGDRAGFITIHPSFLLRLPDAAAQEDAYRDFVRDLRAAKELAGA